MGKRYILIVDDDPDMVETVGMMLESKGYEVEKAYDGIEREESIRKRKPDLVVLDVMMPRKDGYVLCAGTEKEAGDERYPDNSAYGGRGSGAEYLVLTRRRQGYGGRGLYSKAGRCSGPGRSASSGWLSEGREPLMSTIRLGGVKCL